MQRADVVSEKKFNTEAVHRVTYIKTDKLAQETYYMKPGQVIDYHRHPDGDQIFLVHEGEGTCYNDDGREETTELKPGVVVLAPKNVWHKIIAKTELIVSAATSQPAGYEKR